MPPKKEAKKDAIQKEDNSGIPKSDVTFKFEFEVKQNAVPSNIVVLWQWFSADSAVLEMNDASFIENWAPSSPADPNTLVFVKEFDPIRVDDEFCKTITKKQFFVYLVNAEDSKIKHEVLLDYSSLLTNITEKPSYSHSNNKIISILEIDEFKLTISADQLLLQPLYRHYLNPLEIEIVGAKDIPITSDKNYEPCYVKYSFFDGSVTQTPGKLQKSTIKWGYKHVVLTGLLDQIELAETISSHYLKMEVHDKDELLDTRLRQELPLIQVEAKIKEIEEKNKPIEVEVIDPKKKGAAGKDGGKKEAPKKEAAPAKKDAKKDLKKKPGDMKIEPIRELPPGGIEPEYHRNNYGVACFSLADILKPSVRTVKLRAPIVPIKKYEDFESKNLELNTTAKKKIPGVVPNSNFFDCNSFLVITISLPFHLGTFKMPEIVEKISPVEETAATKKGKAAAAAPPAAASKKEEQKPVIAQPILKHSDPAIFERAVYFMPYKSQDFVKKLQDTFYDINLAASKIEAGGLRAIATKKLTEEEKKDRTLDFLGGFEIIDGEFRLFVIEGLADKAMRRLEDVLQRDYPNTEQFKILQNSEVLFQERGYLDFDMDIKRIRLRESLKVILTKPDLYIRTKEPENICRTLNQINEISRCWNIKNVAQFDLFPIASDLIAMERKYSDSLSAEDIHGVAVETKKAKKGKKGGVSYLSGEATRVTVASASALSFQQSRVNITNNSAAQTITVSTRKPASATVYKSSSVNVINTEEQDTETKSLLLGSLLRSKQPHLTHSSKPKAESNHVEVRIRGTLPLAEGQEVCFYASQSKNWYEKQMRELREKIRNDPANFYTYSEQYLSLSIDPFNIEDENKLAQTLEKTKLSQRPPFRPVPPKSKDERDGHLKKPHISKVEEIAMFPYIEQRSKEENALKNTRGEPLKDKKDFNANIFPVTTFSQPEVLEAEKITPVEKERQERENRLKEVQEWESKLKGNKYVYTKKSMSDTPSQLDKIKNMREDPAIKKGLLLKNSRLKGSTLDMDRQLRDLPVSIYLQEGYVEKTDYFCRNVVPEKAMSSVDFDAFQNPEFLTKTMISKPLKLHPMFK